MYCTWGGIRCEKASAYYKHKGFKNVYQLEGGIINYARQVNALGIENKFLGKTLFLTKDASKKYLMKLLQSVINVDLLQIFMSIVLTKLVIYFLFNAIAVRKLWKTVAPHNVWKSIDYHMKNKKHYVKAKGTVMTFLRKVERTIYLTKKTLETFLIH